MKKLLLFVPALLCAGIITAVNASADGQPAAPTYRQLEIHDGSAADLAVFTAPAPGAHVVAVRSGGDSYEFHNATEATVDGTPILLAQADTGSAAAPSSSDTGSSSGSASTPADQLHDPLAAPAATLDDLKAAKKLGWGILALAVLVLLCRLAGRLGGVFKTLGTGKVALVIGAVGALAMTAYNALVLGGTWVAGLAAAIVAAAAYWDSHAKPKEEAKA